MCKNVVYAGMCVTADKVSKTRRNQNASGLVCDRDFYTIPTIGSGLGHSVMFWSFSIARHCSGCWGRTGEQTHKNPCPRGT